MDLTLDENTQGSVMTDLTFVRSSHEINLTTWVFSCPNPHCCDAFVGVMATQAIKTAFEENKPSADLPWMYKNMTRPSDGFSGPAVEHPDTVHFVVPLGPDEDESVAFSTRISDMVDDFIGFFNTELKDEPPKVDPDARGITRELARSLRELAERLEATCCE